MVLISVRAEAKKTIKTIALAADPLDIRRPSEKLSAVTGINGIKTPVQALQGKSVVRNHATQYLRTTLMHGIYLVQKPQPCSSQACIYIYIYVSTQRQKKKKTNKQTCIFVDVFLKPLASSDMIKQKYLFCCALTYPVYGMPPFILSGNPAVAQLKFLYANDVKIRVMYCMHTSDVLITRVNDGQV